MLDIERISYFYTSATDRPGEGAGVLRTLSEDGINLRAFMATPIGPEHTQFVLFPDDPEKMASILRHAGLSVTGPHHALLVEGDDEIGALEGLYRTLQERGIQVYSSLAFASKRGSFGCVLFLKPGDLEEALSALRE